MVFHFLEMAKNRTFASRDFQKQQETVRAGLAEKDRNAAADRLEKVEEYVHGDKWFRYLRNAYLQSP